METEPRFDLSRAIEAWRAKLLNQPGLDSEDIRELQTHLEELYGAGRRRGLGESAAWAEASAKIGDAERLGEEFSKAHPLRQWPARVFVVALAGLLAWAWGTLGSLMNYVCSAVSSQPGTGWAAAFIFWGAVLPLALLFGLACGRLAALSHGVKWLCATRSRLFIAVALFALLFEFARFFILWSHPRPELVFGPGGREHLGSLRFIGISLAQAVFWPGPLVALALWLLPRGHAALNAPRRELLLWCFLGYLGLRVYGTLSGVAYLLVPESVMPSWLLFFLRSYFGVVSGLLLCLGAVLIVNGALASVAEWTSSRALSRARVLMLGLMSVALVYGIWFLAMMPQHVGSSRGLLLLTQVFWPTMMVVLIAWLLPQRGDTRPLPAVGV